MNAHIDTCITFQSNQKIEDEKQIKTVHKVRLKTCAFLLDSSLIISAVPSSHLLSHEVQPALQGVGHFNLPVAVVDLHASGTERQKTNK